jgi:DNA-binding HxlR family transcriptional regulator
MVQEGNLTGSRPSSRLAVAYAHPRPGGDPLDWIEGRWVLEILLCLNLREHRFSDLKAAIPRVSANVLTDRLRALENAGLVERHHMPPPSASKVYRLADPANGLRPALDALATWRAQGLGASRPGHITAVGPSPAS